MYPHTITVKNEVSGILHKFTVKVEIIMGRISLGPRPSRDSFTKEGLVSNVGMLGCAESACDLTIM